MIKRHLPEILLIVLGIVVLWVAASSPVTRESAQASQPEKDTTKIRRDSLYGIVVDSLNVDTFKIKTAQNLSDILTQLGVDMQTIDKIARKSKPVFDVRKIKAGNNYSVMTANDSSKGVKYFVYEKNATDYVVYDLRDSVRVYEGQKDIRRELSTAAGRINSSLWMDLKDEGADPFLAIKLSEIYAWIIDFYAIDDGDSYKVIYEKLYVDDKPAGLGRVQAARFKHAGERFNAYYFVQDSIGDYFDNEANSLRRTFLKVPLRYSRVSSRFSHSRKHPILRVRRPHHGVDYAAPRGTPVHAIGDGKIIKASYSGGAGRFIKIRHNGTYTTGYMHLWKYEEGIEPGKYVEQGDVIGYVGSTGLSTGPHLDFRFYRNGSPVDPMKVESPPAEPVDSAHLERYREHVKEWKKKLNDIKFSEENLATES